MDFSLQHENPPRSTPPTQTSSPNVL